MLAPQTGSRQSTVDRRQSALAITVQNAAVVPLSKVGSNYDCQTAGRPHSFDCTNGWYKCTRSKCTVHMRLAAIMILRRTMYTLPMASP